MEVYFAPQFEIPGYPDCIACKMVVGLDHDQGYPQAHLNASCDSNFFPCHMFVLSI
jgi:hypothetical protein